MKFSYSKNLESEFFYKESKSNKKKILAVARGGRVAWVNNFFSFFKRIQV